MGNTITKNAQRAIKWIQHDEFGRYLRRCQDEAVAFVIDWWGVLHDAMKAYVQIAWDKRAEVEIAIRYVEATVLPLVLKQIKEQTPPFHATINVVFFSFVLNRSVSVSVEDFPPNMLQT